MTAPDETYRTNTPQASHPISLSTSGHFLLVCTGTKLYLYDASTGAILGERSLDRASITKAAFSPDSSLVTCTLEDSVLVLETASLGLSKKIGLDGTGPYFASFSQYSSKLLLTEHEKGVYMLDPVTEAQSCSLARSSTTQAILTTPEDFLLLHSRDTLGLSLSPPDSHRAVDLNHSLPCQYLGYSLSSDLLAASTAESVRIFQASTGELLTELNHPEAAACVFGPNGNRVATATASGTIRLWTRSGSRTFVFSREVQLGEPLAKLARLTSTHLVAIGGGGTVRSWQHGRDNVMDLLSNTGNVHRCRPIGRNGGHRQR